MEIRDGAQKQTETDALEKETYTDRHTDKLRYTKIEDMQTRTDAQR